MPTRPGLCRRFNAALGVALLSLVSTVGAQAAAADAPLPNTAPLAADGEAIASEMLLGMDRFLDRKYAALPATRAAKWKADTSSPEKYRASVADKRARLAKMLGVVDPRVPFDAPELVATTAQPALVGKGTGFEAFAVRWPAVEGVWGEGLLLVPTGREPVADVVALGDADIPPEGLAGLQPWTALRFARRLAENGCRVLVPALVDRNDVWSMPPSGQKTNQPHREYVYRPAFQMGRHVIGYELQKVLAGVDWFARDAGKGGRKVGVIGYGEGGLLALYAGAIDEQIDVVAATGVFGESVPLNEQPIYRNVFGLRAEFGEAELATMVCPRRLVMDLVRGPTVEGPPAPHDGRRGAAPGRLAATDPDRAKAEAARAAELTAGLPKWLSVEPGDSVTGFAAAVGVGKLADTPADLPKWLPANFPDEGARQQRLVSQMVEHTQRLVRESERTTRKAYWAAAPPPAKTPAEKWPAAVADYRKRFELEHLGKFDDPILPPNAKSRKLFETDKVVGYRVQLDVLPDVPAYGILCLPKDLKPGERRPVVVCQHGLDGKPTDVSDPAMNNKFYNQFGLRLAERGYVTFAPQNPYVHGEEFRRLIRKANPLGYTLWSFIVPQHRQITDWLATQPFADPDRIAFYGLSYGGKTAMRVPAVVDRYCLSICSGDFNEWTWKITSLTFP
ncbi:MAG TPA: dienelactone hydrolase family protein, partial [Humisphaera sp.]